MQNVVLGAYAYDLTHSSTFVGVIIFAQLGPTLVLPMVGGLLADKVDRKRFLIILSLEQLVFSARRRARRALAPPIARPARDHGAPGRLRQRDVRARLLGHPARARRQGGPARGDLAQLGPDERVPGHRPGHRRRALLRSSGRPGSSPGNAVDLPLRGGCAADGDAARRAPDGRRRPAAGASSRPASRWPARTRWWAAAWSPSSSSRCWPSPSSGRCRSWRRTTSASTSPSRPTTGSSTPASGPVPWPAPSPSARSSPGRPSPCSCGSASWATRCRSAPSRCSARPIPADVNVAVTGAFYFAFITALNTTLQARLHENVRGPGHGAVDDGLRRHRRHRQPAHRPRRGGRRHHLRSCSSAPSWRLPWPGTRTCAARPRFRSCWGPSWPNRPRAGPSCRAFRSRPGAGVGEVDRAWALVVRQVVTAEGHDLGLELGAGDGAGSGLDDRLDLLAHLGLGNAEDGDVGHGGMQHQDVLDLLRVDVDAAGHDHEQLAVGQVQVALARRGARRPRGWPSPCR